MRVYWAAVVADFRREYRIPAGEIGTLGRREFYWLLANLSPEAVFRHRIREHPVDVTDPAQIAAITARLRS